MMAEDPIDSLIDRVAEAVVRKIEEQQKIDAIAQAVLDRLPQTSAARTLRKPARNASTTKPLNRSTSTRTGRTTKPSTQAQQVGARNTATASTTRARRGAR